MSGAPAAIPPGPPVILCADDFAIAEGVSRGIEELASAGRLSATGAIVTGRLWTGHAVRLAALRSRIAIGLHLNLTLGAPLGACPSLAPDGRFLSIGELSRKAVSGGIDTAEVEAEARRQLDCFVQRAGCAPDFLDGHQHAHALPRMRDGVLAALAAFAPAGGMLLRDPSDGLGAILARAQSIKKAVGVKYLARGLRSAARRAGLIVNEGFSGFSDYDTRRPYARELERGFRRTGHRHLMMCHPGYVDDELRGLDPLTDRREQELAALLAAKGLRERLWRPDRSSGAGIWQAWPR